MVGEATGKSISEGTVDHTELSGILKKKSNLNTVNNFFQDSTLSGYKSARMKIGKK